MDKHKLEKINDYQWCIEARGKMHVPAILFADEALINQMDEKVADQIINVASLPGIVKAAYTMPDAHWGYGFPIGGVAAFDASQDGIISAGGVGFDISCGVRNLRTGLTRKEIEPYLEKLANELYHQIPAGVGAGGHVKLSMSEMNKMLIQGAKWAVNNDYGWDSDLESIEDHGTMQNAKPEYVSVKAKERQLNEMGTLGSGNHYCEVQVITDIYDEKVAKLLQIEKDAVIVSIHTGSRGLGHQIATDYLKEMSTTAAKNQLIFAERELAYAPIHSDLGQRYLGAMRAGINCALTNRQILTHLLRQVFKKIIPDAYLSVLYDVSHNTCKEESYHIDGKERRLYMHRKGATRAFGPDHPALPAQFKKTGQPVLIGGSMGTSSYILVGTSTGSTLSFNSSCHGAGRSLSRRQALKKWNGKELINDLKKKGIFIRSDSYRGIAEEAPLAYKDVTNVVNVAEKSGISKIVARLEPLICIKG